MAQPKLLLNFQCFLQILQSTHLLFKKWVYTSKNASQKLKAELWVY